MVIAFAATSLDTGARIQRLVISELGDAYGIKVLENRFLAGALGIGAALLLAVLALAVLGLGYFTWHLSNRETRVVRTNIQLTEGTELWGLAGGMALEDISRI